MKIRTLIATLILMTVYSANSFSAELVEYTPAALAAAQAENKPIIIDVGAWWCPVCMTQQSRLKKIASSPEFDKVTIMHLSWTGQKEEWKKLDVTHRGTLIAFHGKEERGRLEFDTDKSKITNLVQSAVTN